MVKGQPKTTINKSQYNMATADPSYFITTSPGYLNTAKGQKDDLNSYLMKMIEVIKEEMIMFLKKCREIESNR